MGLKLHLVHDLGYHSKQAGDERNLCQDASFHTIHLSLPKDVHTLVIHSPGIVAGFEVRPTAFVELGSIALDP